MNNLNKSMLAQQEALEALIKMNIEEKIKCFDMLKMLRRDDNMLKNAGFKTFEDAAEYYIHSTVGQIEASIRKFEKDYPDVD